LPKKSHSNRDPDDREDPWGQSPMMKNPHRIVPTLLLLFSSLWFSYRHASPLPYGDEYELTQVLVGRQPMSLSYLLSRHNEHRLPLSRLALHALLPVVGYDFRFAAMAVPLCLAASALALAAALARRRGTWLWTDNLPALLLLSFGNAETLTWGFNLHFGFHVALTLAALACLTPVLATGKPTLSHAACCAIALLLLPGAGVNGALMATCLWPIFTLAFSYHADRKVRVLALSAVAIGIVELLAEFLSMPRAEGAFTGIVPLIESMTAFLSVTVGPAARDHWVVFGSATAFAIGTAAIWLTMIGVRSRNVAVFAAPAVIACSFLFAAAVALRRVGSNPQDAIQDRYFLLQSVVLIAIYWAVGISAEPSLARFRWLLLTIAVAISCGNLDYGLRYAAAYKARSGAMLDDMYAGMPTGVLAEKYHAHPFGLYNPSAEKLHHFLDAWHQSGYGPLQSAIPSPRCRRVPLTETTATFDPATGQLVFDPPIDVHCIAWNWASPGADRKHQAVMLWWPAGGSIDAPIEYRATIGPMTQRDAVQIDSPIQRFALGTLEKDVELQIGRLLVLVPAP